MAPGRWIELDGVHNMRDMGGLPTADGRRIRSRRLLRSENLQSLTARDVERLTGELGVTDIVDLRSDVELHLEGPGPLVHVTELTHHHHSLFPDAGVGPEAVAETARKAMALPWTKDRRARRASKTPERREDRTGPGEHYLGYLAARPDSVSAALTAVAASTGAVVVHCAAGKDRTGTVVAMALAVAGVSEEEIVADYVAAGSKRVEAVVSELRRRPAYADDLRGQPFHEMVPRAETMQHLLQILQDEHGGASGWLLAHGWSEEQLGQLRTKLLD